MKKKMIVGAVAAGLIVAGAASAAQLDTSKVSDSTLAEGKVTVSGATLERISFGTWAQDFASGTDGFIADAGRGSIRAENGVALVNGGTDGGGPFSRLGGYSSTWLGDWSVSMDVYLDTAWATGTGFEHSVAANGSDGNHQRDYIFHVTRDTSTGKLLVGASNNTNFAPREDLETINHHEVASSGWYTFRHEFTSDGGVLNVTMSLVDQQGTELWSETRRDAGDLIPTEVGGNRYLWFTHVSVDDLMIDHVARVFPTPQGHVTGMTVDLEEGNVYVRATVGGSTTAPVQADGNGIAHLPLPAISVQDLQGPISLVVTSNA